MVFDTTLFISAFFEVFISFRVIRVKHLKDRHGKRAGWCGRSG